MKNQNHWSQTETTMRILIFFIAMIVCPALFGQLYIGPGAQFHMLNTSQLTLRDAGFINDGNFSAGNGTVNFSGISNTTIDGSGFVQFYILHLNKDPGQSVQLQRSIGVNSRLQFNQGILDLNGNNIDLGTEGSLINESETSHIIGPLGGEVTVTVPLNAPSSVNAGNLGAVISSVQNLGEVLIKRGHRAITLTNGQSIQRSYVITPSNNGGLDATLRLRYLDSELNGLPEEDLGLWRSVDGLRWDYENFSGRDASQNYVDRTGIDAFSTWTLFTHSSSLPVIFSGFNLQCMDDRVKLHWKTAMELNSSHFIVEKNSGSGWFKIGQLTAAGNSNTELTYEFNDYSSTGTAYYRVAQYDIDGSVQYSSIASADCDGTELFQVWPNPFPNSFTIKIRQNEVSQVNLRVTDALGRTVEHKRLALLNGINQHDVDLSKSAAGIYFVSLEWPESRKIKTIRLIKQ